MADQAGAIDAANAGRGAGGSAPGWHSHHRVTIITRVDCHLCEEAEATVRALSAELGFALEVLDVDADRDRANEYSDRVPVILIDGREHGYWRVEEPRMRAALSKAPRG